MAEKFVHLATHIESSDRRSLHLLRADLEYFKRHSEVLQDSLDVIFDQAKAGDIVTVHRGFESVRVVQWRD